MSEPPREKTDNPEDPVLFVASLHFTEVPHRKQFLCSQYWRLWSPHIDQIPQHAREWECRHREEEGPSQSSRSCHLQTMWIFLSVLSGREPVEDEKRMPEKADIKKARGKNSRGRAVLKFPQNKWKRMKSLSFSISLSHTHTQTTHSKWSLSVYLRLLKESHSMTLSWLLRSL